MKDSPGLYSEEIADQILEHIEDGGTIESACKLDGMPSQSTLRRWRKGEGQGVAEDFAERFEQALRIRLEGFIDDLLQIPRDIDTDSPGELQRARLECENRRWLLSKMLRKQFGDRTAVDVGGQDDNPLVASPETRAKFEAMSPEMIAVIRKAANISMMNEGDEDAQREALQGLLDSMWDEGPGSQSTQ